MAIIYNYKMTSGIYKLTFKTGSTYIGQARDFNKRWTQHFKDLATGKHTKLLQKEYDLAKDLPTPSILLVCHEHYLDIYESYFINELKPNLNSQIPSELDDYDKRWMLVLADNDAAKYSIPQLVQNVYDKSRLEKEVLELRQLVDDDVAIEARAIEGYEEALDKLELLEEENDTLVTNIRKLRAFKRTVESLGWWGRLWKMW